MNPVKCENSNAERNIPRAAPADVENIHNVKLSDPTLSDDAACVGAVTGDLRIQTHLGIFTVESLYGTYFQVINSDGKPSIATIKRTEKLPVYCITTEQQRRFYCSSNQSWLAISPATTGTDNSDTNEKEKVNITSVATKKLAVGSNVMTTVSAHISTSDKGTYTDGFVIGLLFGVQDGVMIWRVDSKNQVAVAVITRWILERDKTIISKKDDSNGFVQIYATNEAMRKCIKRYGITGKALPTSVWTYSEDFRHGYIDALVSTSSSIYQTEPGENSKYYIELKSDMPTVINDISDLFNMYGIINTPNGEYVRADTNTFSMVFRLSNVRMQDILDKTIKSAVSRISVVKILSIEKTEKEETMYHIIVNDKSQSFKTSLGFTGS